MAPTPRFPRSWGPETLRPQRERLGLSRAALSRLSGVSESTIAKLERGRHAVTTPIAVRLCRALQLPSPAPGPILSLPLGGADPAAASRILRQALQEFAAERYDPARFLDRLGPWPSFIEYQLQLHATLSDGETAAALAANLPLTESPHDGR